MSRARTPLKLAVVTGQAEEQPKRFAKRKGEQKLKKLGPPSSDLGPMEIAIWYQILDGIWWLTENHRAILANYCRFQALINEGSREVEVANLCTRLLDKLGGTLASGVRMAGEAGEQGDMDDGSEGMY